MDRRAFLAGASALTAASAARAQTPPAGGAEAALREASARAGANHRSLLLVFHASWCLYCRLFDMLLKHNDAAPIIGRYFEILQLRAQERRAPMQEQQLPGADEVYHRYAPEGAGLPYLVVLGDGSKKISDSIMVASGENFGFPVEPVELDGFEAMLKAGAPTISHGELATLRRVCKALIKEKG